MHPLLWFAGGWLAKSIWDNGGVGIEFARPAPQRLDQDWTCSFCGKEGMDWPDLLWHYVHSHPKSGQAKSIVEQKLLDRYFE